VKHTSLQGALVWVFYALACIILAVALSFYLFGYWDYGYAFWYHWLSIDEHINTYAAQNTLKPQYHLLTASEHVAMFQQVATAVHNNGVGLEQLHYYTNNNVKIQLFHPAEIRHLQDVATLFSQAKAVALLVLLCWPLLALAVLREGRSTWWQRSLGLSVVFVPLLLWLLVAGPTQVFYQLHEWVFPPENAWFFYWEESHMSAMMKAPYLFGAIAVEITISALLLTPLVHCLGIKFALRLRSLFK